MRDYRENSGIAQKLTVPGTMGVPQSIIAATLQSEIFATVVPTW
jgi:hypothetical protein